MSKFVPILRYNEAVLNLLRIQHESIWRSTLRSEAFGPLERLDDCVRNAQILEQRLLPMRRLDHHLDVSIAELQTVTAKLSDDFDLASIQLSITLISDRLDGIAEGLVSIKKLH